MRVALISTEDKSSLMLDKPIVLVGRHEECDIQLDSKKISRMHCCIAQVEDYLVVRDLGSTNGILINGVKQAEGKVRPGDELTIANLTYRPRWESKKRKRTNREAAQANGSSEELAIPERG